MTVRITIQSESAPRRITVDGRLTGAEVSELDLAIGDHPSGTTLELENLLSADPSGLAALRRARAAGARLEGAAPHIAWRIDADEAP